MFKINHDYITRNEINIKTNALLEASREQKALMNLVLKLILNIAGMLAVIIIAVILIVFKLYP